MVNGNSSPGRGITGGYSGDSLGVRISIATFAGVAWYNAIELVILIFVTFSKFRGLYFWSLLVSASIGVVPYSLGFLLKFFQLTSLAWLSVTFLTIGWYCMVTGQSVVLYSRLHLVLRNPSVLKRVLCMIIVNAVILHIPTTVLTYGSNLGDRSGAFVHGYKIMETIQMTGFCIQEFIISGIYIWETIKLLRLDSDGGKRKIMYQLVAINLIIILMDLGLLIIEYMNFYIMETMLKGVVYSIKLKLEFAVLGKLIHLVHSHAWKPDLPNGHLEFPEFVDATRVTSDVTHAAPTIKRRSHPHMDSDDISIAMFEHSYPTRDQEAGPSDASRAWSDDSRMSYLPGSSPVDCTDSLRKLKSDSNHPG